MVLDSGRGKISIPGIIFAINTAFNFFDRKSILGDVEEQDNARAKSLQTKSRRSDTMVLHWNADATKHHPAVETSAM